MLVAILGATATTGLLPSATFQLQSSRDQFVAAFYSAQQRAMAQTNAISIVVTAPNTIDVRERVGGVDQSMTIGGTTYPISLLGNQTLTPIVIGFDRLGQPSTGATVVTLSQGDDNVPITVSATGYIN